MLKFSASVLSGETPVYDGDSLIALMLQRRDLSLQYQLVADSTVETLVAENAQLYLSHVQPTAVYRSVMELQSLGDAPRFRRVEPWVGDGVSCRPQPTTNNETSNKTQMTVLCVIGVHLLVKQNADSLARVPLNQINVTTAHSDFLPVAYLHSDRSPTTYSVA